MARTRSAGACEGWHVGGLVALLAFGDGSCGHQVGGAGSGRGLGPGRSNSSLCSMDGGCGRTHLPADGAQPRTTPTLSSMQPRPTLSRAGRPGGSAQPPTRGCSYRRRCRLFGVAALVRQHAVGIQVPAVAGCGWLDVGGLAGGWFLLLLLLLLPEGGGGDGWGGLGGQGGRLGRGLLLLGASARVVGELVGAREGEGLLHRGGLRGRGCTQKGRGEVWTRDKGMPQA